MDLKGTAARLIEARIALGLSKSDFADSVGIDRSSYTKIEKGEKPLKADMGYEIAERWGVTMDFLYRGRLSDLPENLAQTLRTNRIQRQE